MDIVERLREWLQKRSEPNSGIEYAGPYYDRLIARPARVVLHGRDATFIVDHFHGRGAAELAAALEAQAKRIEELEAALKPFAQYLEEVPFDRDNLGNQLPDETAPGWTYLTAGDFRRAVSTLRKSQP